MINRKISRVLSLSMAMSGLGQIGFVSADDIAPFRRRRGSKSKTSFRCKMSLWMLTLYPAC